MPRTPLDFARAYNSIQLDVASAAWATQRSDPPVLWQTQGRNRVPQKKERKGRWGGCALENTAKGRNSDYEFGSLANVSAALFALWSVGPECYGAFPKMTHALQKKVVFRTKVLYAHACIRNPLLLGRWPDPALVDIKQNGLAPVANGLK